MTVISMFVENIFIDDFYWSVGLVPAFCFFDFKLLWTIVSMIL